jgi:Effector-associated domain 11
MPIQINRVQQSELQEIIKVSCLPVDAFEVLPNTSSKDFILFRYKPNEHFFRITRLPNQEDKYHTEHKGATTFEAPSIGDFSWEVSKLTFKSWILGIKKEAMIKLDWEIPVLENLKTSSTNPETPMHIRVKDAVANNKIEVAIGLLMSYFQFSIDHDNLNIIIGLSARFMEINKREIRGELSTVEILQLRTKLTNNILELNKATIKEQE